MSEARHALSRLPSIERLLGAPAAQELIRCHGRPQLTEALRAAVAELRAEIRAGRAPETDEAGVLARAGASLAEGDAASLRPVFNLTGTVLHTNLGRAPLPESAIAAVAAVARGAANLEFDLATGSRGDRDDHVEAWLTRLTGAEAATVVNNNAAAVLLVLNSLALRKEVLVSRGELIEIGGAFRMPDIMARAGCKLREVGTTNRTHARDFAEALSERAGLILKVHCSNYRIDGFTAEVAERRLAELAHAHGVPFAVDLGSGSLVDLAPFGLPHEPIPGEAIAAGADLVTFSGDKLLGGPQAGLIVGRRELIDRIKRNPLKRALRVDKMTLAALAAVLRLHADPARLARELPTLRLLTRPKSEIAAVVAEVLPPMAAALAGVAHVEATDCLSQIGSGAMPVDLLPSAGLRIRPRRDGAGNLSASDIAAALRALPVPVIGRIRKSAVVLDLRCLTDVAAFVRQLPQLAQLLGSASTDRA